MCEEFYKRPEELHNVVAISSKYQDRFNFKFIKCDTHENMKTLISGGKIKLKNGKTYQSFNCCEIITKTSPKLMFDIDYKSDVSIEDFEKDITLLNTILKSKIKDINFQRLIYIREEDDKTIVKSAHIIYYKCNMKKTEQRELVLYIQDYISDIDPKVYGRNNLFCLPYNTKAKYNNTRKFIPYDIYTREFNSIDNYLINDTKNTNKMEYTELYSKEVIMNVCNDPNSFIYSVCIDKDNIVEKIIELLPRSFYDNGFLWGYLFKYIHTQNCDYGLFMKHSAELTNRECSNEIIQKYIREDLPNLTLNPKFIFYKIAKQYNILLKYNDFTDGFITYASEKTSMDYILLKNKLTEINENNLECDTKITQLHYNQFIIKIYQEIILDTQKETFYYYSQDYTAEDSDYKKQSIISNVSKLENEINKIKAKITVVKALWGSGKTKHLVMRVLEKARRKNKKVLIISENNALNTELTIKLKTEGYDVVNHQDKDNDITDAQIQICSLESINKINYANVVVLDEFETILSHFTSTTLNQNNKTDYTIFKKLKSLLQDTDKVLCLDADISLPRVEWLEKLLNSKSEKYFLTDNNFSNYNFNYFYSCNQLNTDFIEKLKTEKLVYCSSSKKHIQVIMEQVKQMYPDKIILLICNDPIVRINDTHYDKKEFIENLENNIIHHNIDLFLYSPTITTGISIETEYFNRVYAVGFNYKSPIVRSFIQMFFRVRNLKDHSINITTLPTLHFNKYNNKSYEKYIINREDQLLKTKYTSVDNMDEDFNDLRIINTKEICFSERAFTQDIYTRFNHHGITINNIYKDATKSFFKEFMEANAIIKEQKLLELKNVELIDQIDVDTLLHKDDNTYEEKLKLTKFFLLTNVSTKLINRVIDTDKETELYELLIKNGDLLNYTKRLYKYTTADNTIHLQCNGDLQHLTNTDAKQLELKTIMNILRLFNVNKDFTARYTNEKLNSIIDTNKDFVMSNFNQYQVILNIENKIDFLKSTDLFRDTKLFLRSLKDYGIRSGYLSNKNKKWNGCKYLFDYNSAHTDRKYTTFYITLELNDYMKYNTLQDVLPTNLIKLTELNKDYILHDYRHSKFGNVINKKLIKATTNRIYANKKQIRQKSYDDELLYPSEYSNYKATGLSTELDFITTKSNYVKLKLNFNNIYTKQTNTNILTNKILPTIEPIETTSFAEVLNELTSIYGLINCNKKIMNEENKTNTIEYSLECNNLRKYYSSVKILFRENFIEPININYTQTSSDENYNIISDNIDDYNQDYFRINKNLIYFDYAKELLNNIEPQKEYKQKCEFKNDICMVFNKTSRIERIDYILHTN